MRHITRPKGTIEVFLEKEGSLMESCVLLGGVLISLGLRMLVGGSGDMFLFTYLVILLLALWLAPLLVWLERRIKYPWWYKRVHTVTRPGTRLKRKVSLAQLYRSQ